MEWDNVGLQVGRSDKVSGIYLVNWMRRMK